MSSNLIEPQADGQAAALLRAVLEAIPDTVFVKDTQGRYQLINAAGVQIVGRPLAMILGHTDYDLFDHAAATAIRASDQAILATGVATTDEDETSIGGATRYYRTTKRPHRDAAGQIVGILGISQEITERKKAREALARREAQLAESQRLAHLGSWERDLVTNRLSWSDELYRICGLQPQTVPATVDLLLERTHPADVPRLRAIVDAAARGTAPGDYEARLVRPNGEVRWFHSRSVVLHDASGRPTRLVGTAQDITERKQLDADLHDSQRAAARLEGVMLTAREVGHLLNNALAAPVGVMDLLQQQPALPPQLCSLVELARASLLEARECIEHLQQIVRVATKETVAGPTLDLARSRQVDAP